MKKMTKIVAGVAALAALSVSAFSLVACGDGGDGGKNTETKLSGSAEVYGPVHGGSFVGYSKITVVDNAVTDLTLTEICFPTQVTVAKGTSTTSAEDAVANISTTVAASDYVVVNTSSTKTTEGVTTTTYTATAYYKTVSYGSTTFTYDAENKTYLNGTTTMSVYMQDETNAKAYYDAVKANNVAVSLNGAEDKTVMTYNALCKDENGYWNVQDDAGETYSRWKLNRDATVNYVKQYGIDNLFNLKKSTTSVEDSKGVESLYWMDGTISTGATWNDMSKVPSASVGYYSYAELITRAYYKAVAKVYQGEVNYTQYYTNYGVKVEVAVGADNKILNVAILPSSLTQVSTYYGDANWTEAKKDAYLAEEVSLLKKYVGKSVAEIKAATATIDGYNEAEENSVSISELKTGASQSSARLLLAVKDALKNA
jgi:hypothetical protein